jgi:hypothetical protein
VPGGYDKDKMKNIDTDGRQPTKIHMYLDRRRMMKMIILSSLGPALWISACDPTSADAPLKMKPKKDSKMESIKPEPTIQIKLPPIDAARPAEIQTATFAMG